MNAHIIYKNMHVLYVYMHIIYAWNMGHKTAKYSKITTHKKSPKKKPPSHCSADGPHSHTTPPHSPQTVANVRTCQRTS